MDIWSGHLGIDSGSSNGTMYGSGLFRFVCAPAFVFRLLSTGDANGRDCTVKNVCLPWATTGVLGATQVTELAQNRFEHLLANDDVLHFFRYFPIPHDVFQADRISAVQM